MRIQIINPNTTAAFTQLSLGAVVAHNPISNLRLGTGIMPFRALRERGVPICLGTDEAILYHEGKLCTLDEAALRQEAQEHAERLKTSQAAAAAAAGEWLPYYREMYLKAAATDVGLRRCSGDRDG